MESGTIKLLLYYMLILSQLQPQLDACLTVQIFTQFFMLCCHFFWLCVLNEMILKYQARQIPLSAPHNPILNELPQWNVQHCTPSKSNHLKSKNSLPTITVIAKSHQVPLESQSYQWYELNARAIPCTSPFQLVVETEDM